jgi:CheY-like chemotaxis protein
VAAEQESEIHEKRVLLIDSNPTTQQARAKLLRAHGVHVQTADSIQQAELLWSPGFFNLIMLDVRENSAEAIAFWRRVKRDSPRQRVLRLGPPFVLRQTQHSRAA